MELINASRLASPIKNGSTKPYYIVCEDGQTYAVKFQQNPQGIKAIINEYICSELATILKLPIPEPVLINISDEFINHNGAKLSGFIGEEVKSGIHFGTKKIKKAFTIEGPGVAGAMLDFATNIGVIAEIFIFDLLICNNDRDSNGGNLLFDDAKKQIVILDHTHVFDLGCIWDATQLNMRYGEPFKVINPSGFVYNRLVPYVTGWNPFGNIIGKISRMTSDQISHIINSVPKEWSLLPEENEALRRYLVDRKERISETLPLLRPYMPRWRGGP